MLWPGGSVTSIPLPYTTDITLELLRGLREARLSILPTGEIAYGRAVLTWFDPVPSADRDACREALAASVVSAVVDPPSGIACDPIEDGGTAFGLYALWPPSVAGTGGYTNMLMTLGYTSDDEDEAIEAGESLCSTLLRAPYPLEVLEVRGTFEINVRNDLGGAWPEENADFSANTLDFWTGKESNSIESLFEVTRVLSACEGVFRQEWVYTHVGRAPGLPQPSKGPSSVKGPPVTSRYRRDPTE
jgi:hypothetical protein